MHRLKVATVSGLLLFPLLSGCGGSDSGSSASGAPSSGGSPSAGTSASPTASGFMFTSQQWHFSMRFPSDPSQQPLNQVVQGAKITGQVFDASSKDDGVAVSVVQFPTSVSVDVDGALRGAVTGAAQNTHGTVVEQHAETFQGRPARAAVIHVAQSNSDIYLEAFYDKRRSYNILGAPRNQFDAAKASFQFR